ncbi:GerAB/ArcD/ProY family transporter [Fictibacillus phosphorivorans]|uniref:GerAB/ArcD/ProY family transporter n=1 Tax=Fictibacillus phosphorivorans TaxID=1221500 RepID=UPI00203DF116|nr:GerAB/ArcD/ProY family transporter [Fictibacillus phosphorivorans]MCM3718576.1 spore germination protein [Fictibacillus phosphorivorans]MCM3776199.1 spore germination protein [Fictibacillus phosphorivorans]
MKSYKIDLQQYFILIILFELGSAILVGLGMDAGRDAWIAILFGMVAGMILFSGYYFLYKQFPDLSLTQYVQVLFGKHIGKIFGFCYMLYFLYLAARVLRDFGSLLLSAVFVQTPIIVVNTLMIATIVYVLKLGFEVLVRTGEIFFVLVALLGVILTVLVLSADLMDFNYLLPIFGEGVMPVLKAAFPVTPTFPFGEMVVFTMLLPYLKVKNRNKALKIGLLGMGVSGFVLSTTIAMDIAVLGGHVATHVYFPLLAAVAKINIGEFIQRLDAIVVFTLIIGGFFKVAVFLYVSVKAAQDVFGVKEETSIIGPIGVVVILSSIAIASNYVEHINEGLNIVPDFIHIPFQAVLPALFIIVFLLRKKKLKHFASSSSS